MTSRYQQLSLFKIFEFWNEIRKGGVRVPPDQQQRRQRARKRRDSLEQPLKKRRASSSSDVELLQLWKTLRAHHFPDRCDIDSYIIVWSARSQKRTLASCNINRRRVIVARELNYDQYRRWLSPLLYHEMCHAVLGNTVKRWHGPEFKALEKRHPEMKSFDAWVKNGGWATAIRSDRAKRAIQMRRGNDKKR